MRRADHFEECSYEVVFCDGQKTDVVTCMTIIDAAVDGCVKTGHDFSEITVISKKGVTGADAYLYAGHRN